MFSFAQNYIHNYFSTSESTYAFLETATPDAMFKNIPFNIQERALYNIFRHICTSDWCDEMMLRFIINSMLFKNFQLVNDSFYIDCVRPMLTKNIYFVKIFFEEFGIRQVKPIFSIPLYQNLDYNVFSYLFNIYGKNMSFYYSKNIVTSKYDIGIQTIMLLSMFKKKDNEIEFDRFTNDVIENKRDDLMGIIISRFI
jgi:hypothetical protein